MLYPLYFGDLFRFTILSANSVLPPFNLKNHKNYLGQIWLKTESREFYKEDKKSF